VYSLCEVLKWKHVTPEIDNSNGQVVEAKMLVYAEQNEGKKKQKIVFVSGTAFQFLKYPYSMILFTMTPSQPTTITKCVGSPGFQAFHNC